MSTADLRDPAVVAEIVLTAYQNRDLETLSDYTGGPTRVMIKELIELGSGHPRYRSIFDGWRWKAVTAWDGRILDTRYRARRRARALVHFHSINAYELAVLALEWKDGRWEFVDIQSPDSVEYETLGDAIGELV